MARMNLATIWSSSSLLLLLLIWMVDAAKIESSEAHRIPTSETTSFATTDSNGSIEAFTHNGNQKRNHYPGKPSHITYSDLYELGNACGWEGKADLAAVRRMIGKFGAETVVTVIVGGRGEWSSRQTCLHRAADNNKAAIIALLVENGANLETQDDKEETPLRLAIKAKHYAAITMLIKLGASLRKADETSDFLQWIFDNVMEEKKTKAAIQAGLRAADPKWGLKMEYRATSTYGKKYAAEKAMKGQLDYWCSAKEENAPIYWRISFVEKPVKIIKIKFEEVYSGAEFQFFASNDPEKCNADEVLIEGTQEKMNGMKFKNDRFYHCYGLKITKPANTRYGSLKDLEFFLQDDVNDCEERNCSGNGECQDEGINDYSCFCNSGYSGKDCQFYASSVYDESYAASKANVTGGYYCSEKNADLPVYWWMSLGEEKGKIISIQFEEKYKGAEFEFFVSNTKECGTEGKVLISGTQEDISGKEFNNESQIYHCYGLKITKLGRNGYASLMNLKYIH